MNRLAIHPCCMLFTLLSALWACGDSKSKTVTPTDTTHAVGGAVTGSNGNVLLACNDDTVTVVGNGNFACPDKLHTGDAYVVSVQSAPAALTCTVDGGTGTVGTADVTSVAVSCAQTSFSVTLSVAGLFADSTLGVSLGGIVQQVAHNGDLPIMMQGTSGQSVPVSIAAQPAGQLCQLNLSAFNFSVTPATVAVACARDMRIASMQAADAVLGQTDFVTNTAPALPAALGALNVPAGRVAGVSDGLVFIAEYGGNQVTALVPGADAVGAFRLGVDVTQNGSARYGREDLSGPVGVAASDTQLAVVSGAGSRVLLYNAIPHGPAPADIVVGQVGFGSAPVLSCSPNNFVAPTDAAFGAGKLFVSDSGCNRVLVFDPVPVGNNAGASLVLGQADLIHNYSAANRGGGPASGTMYHPGSVWANSNTLFVADSYNNRVLVWLSMPTQSGQLADVVVGQGSFTTAASGIGTSGMSIPYGLVADEHALFVADASNNRVLVFPLPLPTNLPAQATGVLGQVDFTSNTRNAPSQQPTGQGLYQPTGLGFYKATLLVNDAQNYRVLGYASR